MINATLSKSVANVTEERFWVPSGSANFLPVNAQTDTSAKVKTRKPSRTHQGNGEVTPAVLYVGTRCLSLADTIRAVVVRVRQANKN